MYCEKCGTKNIKNALYCEKCGKKLPKNSKNPKLNLSKNKLITSIVVIIIIICLLILSILLNNPIKKVEDNFDSFYTKYTAKSDLSKLTEIGKVIKNNQDDSKILNNIKDTSYKIINRWVKNFNTNYKDADALEKAYSKITGILYDIYNYYDGLEYILDEKTYTNYKESLNDLYYSKNAYLEALKQKEDYYKYYYYQKVIEEDSYYNKAETFIAKFVEKEINTLKEEANKIVNIVNTKNDQEILDAYFTKLDYLDEHAYQHNIDISNTKEYQKLYQDTLKNIVEYTKRIVKTNNDNYTNKIKFIEKSLAKIKDEKNTYYKELTTLKKEYENLEPDSLLNKYLISETYGSSYSKNSKTINNTDYDGYISFNLSKEEALVYRIDKEYKTFKTQILSEELSEIDGYIIIFGDNKELYKSEPLNKLNNNKIEIDVTNIKELKIAYIGAKNASDINIYLVEPYLYR